MSLGVDREPVFLPLVDSSDERGASFSVVADLLDRIGSVQDLHIASLAPGAIRGNHYHVKKNEIINVLSSGRWSFTWDTGEGTPVQTRRFEGGDGVAVVVPPIGAHAVKNEGTGTMWIVVASDKAFNRLAESEAEKDSFRRIVKE
jgi:oxalate decarboxylase/phosphoglucose isomerase-like protein (cupin superfamily)